MTEALVRGFSSARTVNPRFADLAFAMWNAAEAIITERLPRLDSSDDAPFAYEASPNVISDDVDVAFALAAMSAVAHPLRERKRLALLATTSLLHEAPKESALAVKRCLLELTEPATLGWFLKVLHDHAPRSVLSAAVAELETIARMESLTISALARWLLARSGIDESSAAVAPEPDAELLDSRVLVRDQGVPQKVSAIVEHTIGDRLDRAEELLPGISAASQRRIAEAIEMKSYRKRISSQLDELSGSRRSYVPDAFIAVNEIAEDAIQRVAAGGRVATARNGIVSPPRWETYLAHAVLSDPSFPLSVERTRIPRPNVRIPPGRSESAWIPIDRDSYDTAQDALWAEACRTAVSTLARLEGGPLDEWLVIAFVEKRIIDSIGWSRSSEATTHRFGAIEPLNALRDDLPPFRLGGDGRAWMEALVTRGEGYFGIDQECLFSPDARNGLGWSGKILTPTHGLVILLDLRPASEEFVLRDQHGPAVALRTWRAGYDISDYSGPRARLIGSAIVLRPDLLGKLTAASPAVWREFVSGELAKNEAPDSTEPRAP